MASKKPAPPGPHDQALRDACTRGDAAEATRLIAAGADPSAADRRTGYTPLHEAANGGHASIVAALLAAGAAVDAPLKNAHTPPLGCAVYGGHVEIARTLLAAGASPSLAYDRTRQTALHAAASAGDPAMVAVLLEHGADVQARTGNGLTPLGAAVLAAADPDRVEAFVTIVAALRAAGADPEAACDGAGTSAITLARELDRTGVLPALERG